MKGRKEHWKTKERMKECHTRKKETRSSGKGKKACAFSVGGGGGGGDVETLKL